MKKKKPDLVVWDEEKGYYSKELSYGSNVGAPAIKLEDVGGWKNRFLLDSQTQGPENSHGEGADSDSEIQLSGMV